MIGTRLVKKYLVCLIVVFSFFDTVSINLPWISNSHRLVLVLTLGLIFLSYDKLLSFFKKKYIMTSVFLLLVLLGITSIWWANQISYSVDYLWYWLTGLVLYIYFGLERLSKSEIINLIYLWCWLGLFCFIVDMLALVDTDSWLAFMKTLFSIETANFYLIELEKFSFHKVLKKKFFLN